MTTPPSARSAITSSTPRSSTTSGATPTRTPIPVPPAPALDDEDTDPGAKAPAAPGRAAGPRPGPPNRARPAPPRPGDGGTQVNAPAAESRHFDASSQLMDDYSQLATDVWQNFLGLSAPAKVGIGGAAVALLSTVFPFETIVTLAGITDDVAGVSGLGILSLVLAAAALGVAWYRLARQPRDGAALRADPGGDRRRGPRLGWGLPPPRHGPPRPAHQPPPLPAGAGHRGLPQPDGVDRGPHRRRGRPQRRLTPAPAGPVAGDGGLGRVSRSAPGAGAGCSSPPRRWTRPWRRRQSSG